MDLLKEGRKQEILLELETKPSISVAKLSKKFKVSEVTIRKDLKELDQAGYLLRTHGGATNLNKMGFESLQSEKEQINVAEKNAIAEAALDVLQDGESILIDAGSTTLLLARKLRTANKKITVVTNSFTIANEVVDAENVELIMVGGIFRKGIYSCVGPIAINILQELYVDKCFLGINSLDMARGLTTANLYEAEVKKQMLKSARERYLLTDHTKFGKTSLCAVSGIEDIDCVITDGNIPSQYATYIKENNVQLIVTT